MNKIVELVRSSLAAHANEKTKESFQKFFKEQTKFYGVKSVIVRQIAKKYLCEIEKLEKQEIFDVCEQLFESRVGEDFWIGGFWVDRISAQFATKDFDIFERWIITYVDNWAKCDHLCNHAVGSLLQKYPDSVQRLKIWTQSNNRWLRRAAAVSLIIPAKKGLFLNLIFGIADLLLLDKDDMVQKGYGWLLKEASKPYQVDVFEYVMNHKTQMPRTALRYAIEKMPAMFRAQAMVKI